jgi:hypothetical protein
MDRRRAFVRQQEAQRRAFHDQTSFKVFPLQSLAIEDYDNLMRVYRADADAGATEEEVNVVVDVDNGDADMHQKLVTTTTESQSTLISDKNNNDDEQSSKQHTDDDGGCRSYLEESNLINTVVEEEVKNDVELLQQQESSHDDNKSSSSSSSSTSTLWSKEPRLFAMETTVCGKRRYISAHLGRFMDRYWKECTVDTRHYYELIKEDAPCRLYFGK